MTKKAVLAFNMILLKVLAISKSPTIVLYILHLLFTNPHKGFQWNVDPVIITRAILIVIILWQNVSVFLRTTQWFSQLCTFWLLEVSRIINEILILLLWSLDYL